MPTYLYECPRCGEFEADQAMSAKPLSLCPTCGDAVRRLIAGGTGFIMKGRSSEGRGACDRTTPCCGREVRCDRPPCGD